ncbi:hypothetical protein G1C96_0372 [Bifidobacterium sp. DSM 109958]|uniref:DUF218 domain-containing protein n=1 Tax=Bifidobacterium moraviense TaxID=2675323 RepID=A0A7Y0F0J8_9BIFI|nr:YdcF family protein [Bifidobacterium sp. DSM 109958]NMM99794.1 hypothetical protein [Bifidobacterium sp. DSM 109958]
MFTFLPDPQWLLVPAVALLACFALSMDREPRRLRNAIALFLGLWLLALGVMIRLLTMDVAWNAMVTLVTVLALAPPFAFGVRCLTHAAMAPLRRPEYPLFPVAGVLTGLAAGIASLAWCALMGMATFVPAAFYAIADSQELSRAMAVLGALVLDLSLPFAAWRLWSAACAVRPVDAARCDVILVQGRTVDGDRLDERRIDARSPKPDPSRPLSRPLPGPLLAARLDRAVQLWNASAGAATIAVGGVRDDDGTDDTVRMRSMLEARGVPSSRIVRLTDGTLQGNLQALAARKGRRGRDADTREDADVRGRDAGVLLVTDPYDLPRAAALCAQLGIPSASAAAAVPVGWRTVRMMREYAALVREHWAAFGAPVLLLSIVAFMVMP